MDNVKNPETITPKKENIKNVKLIFRLGERDEPISTYQGKISIIDRALKDAPVAGISYTCELRPMVKGNGWIVVAFEKSPVIKACLVFKKGKKIYNEKKQAYKENMVSTFNDEIVIVPQAIIVELDKSYDCEVALSPNGRAYIVEKAVLSPPAEAKIITHPSPEFVVQVQIGGIVQNDLTFNPAEHDERDIMWRVLKFGMRSIFDKDMIVSNYESCCKEMLSEYIRNTYK